MASALIRRAGNDPGAGRRARVLGLVVVLVVGATVWNGPPAGAALDGRFLMYSANSEASVLDVPGGAVAPGVPVVLWQANAGANQQMVAVPFGENVVALFFVHSGMVLDVAGASTTDGAPVIQWPWHGGLNQLWLVVTYIPDLFVFVSLNSGKVLDVTGASRANGTPIIQWPWHGGLNQLWSAATLNFPESGPGG